MRIANCDGHNRSGKKLEKDSNLNVMGGVGHGID